jgi:flagella basal body P-ring formation protein FlgA
MQVSLQTALLSLSFAFATQVAYAEPQRQLQLLADNVIAHAERVVAERYPDARMTLSAPTLPDLSKMERSCVNPSTEIQDNWQPGRIAIRVKCPAPGPWSFYTSVSADIRVNALATTRLLARGSIVTQGDIEARWVKLSHHGEDRLQILGDALGRKVRRTLRAGSPLRGSDLITPPAVNKGERVIILARAGAAQITTTGIALKDGHIGEQIAVRNETSNKVIRPWVMAKGKVSTKPLKT